MPPCGTSRPEQREWKTLLRPTPVAPPNEPSRAARRIMTDDGFTIGGLYKGEVPPYQPPLGKAKKSVTDLEKGFAI